MATWNSSYELSPAQSDPPSYLGHTGRGVRVDIRERWENEHSSYTTKGGSSGGTIANDFVHKKGSARAYYQSTSPSLRPDGSTTLGSSDDGRLWVDTSVGYTLKVWTGSAWQAVTSSASPFRVYGDTTYYTELGNAVSYGYIQVFGSRPLLLNQSGGWVAVNYNSTTSPGANFFVNGDMKASNLTLTSALNASWISVNSVGCNYITCNTNINTNAIATSGTGYFIRVTFYNSTSYIDWNHNSFSTLITSGTGTQYFVIYRPCTVRFVFGSYGESASISLQCYNGSTWTGVSAQFDIVGGSNVICLNPGYYRYTTYDISSVVLYSIGVFGGNTTHAF